MSWRTLLAAAVGALLLASPLAARQAAIPSGNLVVNPGAEDSPGAVPDTVVKPVGWTTTGSLTNWMYQAHELDRPTQAFAATISGGSNFFSGGPGGVAGPATEIDAGQVGATLSAFIGGYTVSEDLARVDAVFYDAAGTKLGSMGIGPVNRDDRKRLTTLLPRKSTASVPKLTRRIDVVISVKVDNNGKNHAYVDNISLTLAKVVAAPPATGKATLVAVCSGKTLVATVRPAKGSTVKSVAFLVNAKPVVIDRKAPFTARIPTGALPAQLKVTARVQAAGKTVTLTKALPRCKGAA